MFVTNPQSPTKKPDQSGLGRSILSWSTGSPSCRRGGVLNVTGDYCKMILIDPGLIKRTDKRKNNERTGVLFLLLQKITYLTCQPELSKQDLPRKRRRIPSKPLKGANEKKPTYYPLLWTITDSSVRNGCWMGDPVGDRHFSNKQNNDLPDRWTVDSLLLLTVNDNTNNTRFIKRLTRKRPKDLVGHIRRLYVNGSRRKDFCAVRWNPVRYVDRVST